MIHLLEKHLHSWRHRLSRSEALVRLLRLPVTPDPPEAHGLLLVRVEGLGAGDLRRALARGQMRFLRRLVDHEHFACRPLRAPLPLHEIPGAGGLMVDDLRPVHRAVLTLTHWPGGLHGQTVAAACLDVARGVPLLHLSLSMPDHSPPSLRALDAAVARLWDAAHRSRRRTYDLWVHGGSETDAFSLLPTTAAVPHDSAALHPADLSGAALTWLERGPAPAVATTMPGRTPGRLRVMTYNIHSCIGLDGRALPRRIARVIAGQHPDVVCLQEVDVGHKRSHGIDQAQAIAHTLEMEFHFHPNLFVEEEAQYGNAILSRLPLRLLRAGPLPSPFGQQRGAMKVEVSTPAGPVQVVNTHLGVLPRERRPQAGGLVAQGWLERPDDVPLLLCGDFNSLPGGVVHRLFVGQGLSDAAATATPRPGPTFPSRLPAARLDHVFASPSLRIDAAAVPRGALAVVASDHLPLVVDVALPYPATRYWAGSG